MNERQDADTVDKLALKRAGLEITSHGYNLRPWNREDAEVLAYLAVRTYLSLTVPPAHIDGDVDSL
jgi:hypothetical protein